MLFNSYGFIFFFACVLAGYFLLCKYKWYTLSILFLLLASLFFYGYWNPIYLPLMLISIIINYFFGLLLGKFQFEARRIILFLGITFNIVLLAYFKYCDFFITNFNYFSTHSIELFKIVLPLGISFFTFTQIAFLVDAYQNRIKEFNFLNYGLFVTFFPHLLAGPIVHHAEMMPQFACDQNKTINYKNLVIGLMVFAIGLIKKAYIADTLAEWANLGYARIEYLTMLEAWFVSFSYTLQLYFDFSGYTDMAIGCSLMLNIKLPENFNSPYKALNIEDFWRRWHMTLSRWLRNYIYIPLGGNRGSSFAMHRNLLLTFLIGGFWHGAGWTYIIWGSLHGIAISIHKLWKTTNIKLPKPFAWLLTFLFVNVAWIFFRAESLSQATQLIKKMIVPSQLALPSFIGLLHVSIVQNLSSNDLSFFMLFSLFTFICLGAKNSIELKSTYSGTLIGNFLIASALAFGILSLMRVTTFIYFQF